MATKLDRKIQEGIIDLGATALAEVDPSGLATKGYALRFCSPGHEHHNRPSHFLKKGVEPEACFEALQQKILSQMNNNRWESIYQYETEMLSKHGPQGGKISLAIAESKLLDYYRRAHLKRKFVLVRRGVRCLVRELEARVRRDGMPQIYRQLFVQATAGGLPTCKKKNARIGSSEYYIAHAEGYTYFGSLQPTLVSFRRMRNKDRLVFMDSTLNVDRINPYLSAVRNWFKDQYPVLFAALRNPEEYLWAKITKYLHDPRFANLETDFKSMDTWVNFEVAKTCMLPIFKVLLTPDDYLNFSSLVEAYFHQEALIGTRLWTGDHCLFSGQSITQDVENFYDICLYLGAYLELGKSFEQFVDMFTMVGDDVIAFIEKDKVDLLHALILEETTINRVELSDEKTRKDTPEVRFCRNVYCKSLPRNYNWEGKTFSRPAYPLVLATNSIVYPENENERFGVELSAIIARCDNAAGNPFWRTWAEWILSLLEIPFLPTEEQFIEYQLSDWWTKVYGETYSLSQSPTYQLWSKLLENRRK